MPPEILGLILSWHRPVCAQQFTGNPHYTLYWCYDKDALREILGMTSDQYRVVQSSLGSFLRRVPKTTNWLATLKSVTAARQGPGANGSSQRSEAGAVARRQICRKSYVGLAAPEHQQFT